MYTDCKATVVLGFTVIKVHIYLSAELREILRFCFSGKLSLDSLSKVQTC